MHHVSKLDMDMKNIKQLVAILGLLTVAHCNFCQENHAATPVDAEQPAWHWRCDGGDALFNFNPAITVDSVHTAVFDSIPYSKDYTMVVVYRPVSPMEATVWKLDFGDSSCRGLTTEHIVSNRITIRYADTTTEAPIINTLRQSAPDSIAPYVRLTLGGDTLHGSVTVAEVLYFNHRLDNLMLRRVQSALAVRYGITLGPVDYVDGRGLTVWNHSDSGLYHHRVTGIGIDSTYGLCQLQSRSEMAGSMLTVMADSLAEGRFFICGDNDAPLSFESDGDIEVLERIWRINCTNVEDNDFHLSFDTHGFTNDSLVLIADGFVYLPYSMSADEVTFRHVTFEADTGSFTLAKGGGFGQTAKNSRKGVCNALGNTIVIETNVYPNPSTGSYTIEVTGASWVEVNVYNTQGVLMANFSDHETMQYVFSGELPKGNTYYATVTTENGSQTLKLIVK